jgi:hypothetical protein
MEYQTEDQEIQEANKIALDYFRKVTKTEPEAQEMMSKLARVLQDEGAKIVHLGNVLFLVLVRAKGVVEIHVIGEDKLENMITNFKKLAGYLKNIGVKTAYGYAEDKRFSRLIESVDLRINQYKADYEGKDLNVFVVEL